MDADLLNPTVAPRAEELLDQQKQRLCARLDRVFGVLLPLEWLAAVVTAVWRSLWTWDGVDAQVHPHVWIALVGGGVIAVGPAILAWTMPGKPVTRYVISTAQAMFSCLLILVSGGRIETHFHVFVSLAFLASYRQWSILLPATAVIAADHFLRGVWWPESVFGVLVASPYRWIEHAAWVLFEDFVLIFTIRQGQEEMRIAAVSTAEAEAKQQTLLEFANQAAAATRAKSDFLANMSHEIRTPLNGILGFTELLIRSVESGDDVDRDEYARTIRTSGRHLLELINNVLDLSKMESGSIQVEHVACSPHQIIAEVASLLRVRAQEQGIALEYRWEGPAPQSVLSDPYRLRQVLMNLVSNAIKFTTRGSVQIIGKLDLSQPQARLCFEVRDTGIGIGPEQMAEIFKPFTQADTSVTRRFGGTGLGLSISKGVVEALGGTLTAASQVDRGSTFYVTLPIGDVKALRMIEGASVRTASDVRPSKRRDGSLAGMSILLADDGETNRKLMQLFLVREGAEATAVENGELACAAMAARKFDVVLMDMQMPVMDGYEATRALRERGFRGPIIALTAHAMKGDREKCLEAGCSGYVSKPVNMDELVRQIALAAENCGEAQPEDSQMNHAPTASSPPSQSAASPVAELIHSTLPTEDDEIREIVAEFAASIPDRITALEDALASNDYSALASLAHALKGAGGSAGYQCLSDVSVRIEQHAKQRHAGAIQSDLNELHELSERLAV